MSEVLTESDRDMNKEILESLEILQNVALDDAIHAESDAARNYYFGRMVGFKLAQRVMESEE